MGLNTNLTDRLPLIKGPNRVEVFSLDDLPDAIGGIITLPAATYEFKQPITLADRLKPATDAIVSLVVDDSGLAPVITYTGTDALFSSSATGDASGWVFNGLSITLTQNNAVLFDITSSFFANFIGLFISWTGTGGDIGTVSGASLATSFDTCVFIGFAVGITIGKTPIFTMKEMSMVTDFSGGTTIVTVNDGDTGNMTIATFSVTADPSDNIFNIDPTFSGGASIVDVTNAFGANLFAAGTTGAFTAVADAAFASESITSVSDSSGIARFNFTTPPVLFVGQEVTIIGYVTNTAYNVTGIITVTGVGFFEISSIAFGTNEAGGSFTSDTVTVTATSHGLAELTSLQMDTTLATDYDGGFKIYNALTNSFQINAAFTVTRAGTWDTGSLDQTSSQVKAFSNTGEISSGSTINCFVNDNSTANGTIVNNTFTDVVFGTAGDALIEAAGAEQWKLIDEVLGILEYTGNEPYKGTIRMDITAVSAGGDVEFRYKYQKSTDGGTVFNNLTDDVEALIDVGSTATSTSKDIPFTANPGDQIKPQITRNTGSSTITTSYFTVNVITTTNI